MKQDPRQVTYGGNQELICERCERRRIKHAIHKMFPDDHVTGAVKGVVDNLRQKVDDFYMVGALLAQFNSGAEPVRMVATSGPPSTSPLQGHPKMLSGLQVKGPWEACATAVPETPEGGDAGGDRRPRFWNDIYGLRVQRMTTPPTGRLGMPCAAVQLLMCLGQHPQARAQKYDYKSISLYEEVYKPPKHLWDKALEEQERAGRYDAALDRAQAFRKWHGQDPDNTYAAHSCDPCIARLPVLLCDGDFRA